MSNETPETEWDEYPTPAPYTTDVDDSAPFEEVSAPSIDGTEGSAVVNNRLVLSSEEAEFAEHLRAEWRESEEERIDAETNRRPEAEAEAAAELRALRVELQEALAEELDIAEIYTEFREKQQELQEQ
jgi:hypothetical protein